MPVREILQVTNEVTTIAGTVFPEALRRKVPHVIHESAVLASCYADLKDTFAATRACIGLAAPQLGIRVRAVIVDTSPQRCNTFLMYEPEITWTKDTQLVRDGCMSVEHGRKFVHTRRPKHIAVSWTDEYGNPQRRKFRGLEAAAICHEIDHLNGIVFTDLVKEDK
jgi:peptide deformylase